MSILGSLLKAIVVGPKWQDVDRVEPRFNGSYTDECGHVVHKVKANNYMEATRVREGATIGGDVHKEAVHTGVNQWELRIKETDKRGAKR